MLKTGREKDSLFQRTPLLRTARFMPYLMGVAFYHPVAFMKKLIKSAVVTAFYEQFIKLMFCYIDCHKNDDNLFNMVIVNLTITPPNKNNIRFKPA
jgi:hypothetical protein